MTLAAQVEHPKMVRMEVRFSPDEMASITAKARRLGISKSEVVRRCVRPLVTAAEPWVSPFEDMRISRLATNAWKSRFRRTARAARNPRRISNRVIAEIVKRPS